MTSSVDRDLEVFKEALGRGPDAQRQARQRVALARTLAAEPRRGRRLRTAFVAAAALGLALVVALSLVLWNAMEPSPEQAPVCRLRGGAPLKAGDAVEASASKEVAIDFEGGSELVLLPRTRARLRLSSRERVLVELEAGRLRARVRRDRSETRPRTWTCRAGPYAVRVTGTVFQIAWNPRSEDLGVAVTRGNVRVTGPGIDGPGLAVARGERLDANGKRRDRRLHRRDEPELAPDAGVPGAGAPDAGRPDARPRSGKTNAKPSMRWRTLAATGQFDAAAKSAQRAGLKPLFRRLSAKDLYTLADALRLGGKLADARRGFRALRKRFAGRPIAATAAFQLGRLAWEAKDYAGAARSFRALLREAPKSRLANDARGRLMVALSRSGRAREAREVAGEYLKRAPQGSFSQAAKKIAKRAETR